MSMETNNFPDRIYLPRDVEYPQSPDIWWEREPDESNIEYIRTDALIKKACEFFAPYIPDNNGGYERAAVIEDFKNYIKGE